MGAQQIGEFLGQLGRVGLFTEVDPVLEIVSHVVAAERQHGKGIVPAVRSRAAAVTSEPTMDPINAP